MNLRTHRSAEKNEPKSDPKAPHVFQEAVEGIGICLVCTHARAIRGISRLRTAARAAGASSPSQRLMRGPRSRPAIIRP